MDNLPAFWLVLSTYNSVHLSSFLICSALYNFPFLNEFGFTVNLSLNLVTLNLLAHQLAINSSEKNSKMKKRCPSSGIGRRKGDRKVVPKLQAE